MADQVKCIDGCGAVLSNPVRPEYTVKKTGHTIRPAARCNGCRQKYETTRCWEGGGLKKVQ